MLEDYSVTWAEVRTLVNKILQEQKINENDKVAFGEIERAVEKSWLYLFEEMNERYKQSVP